MATLSLEQVTKVFSNGAEAVRALDLFVDEGEFVVLVGPSGCGKTTVLRMVAGLEDVTSGTIRLDGKRRQRPLGEGTGRRHGLPELRPLPAPECAPEHRLLPSGARRSEARARAEGTRGGRRCSGSRRSSRKPGQLSGGQRQRVAMGRALVREPTVFLMDEPLSNLDANLRVQMRSEVLRVQRRLGVATLYVTHDQTEAMTMGDRVAVLRDGTLSSWPRRRSSTSAPRTCSSPRSSARRR